MIPPNNRTIDTERLKIFSFDDKPMELAVIKNAVIGCDPGSKSGDCQVIPSDIKIEFELKGTHKNQRQARTLRKALDIHKPRLPRKKKKETKKWLIERKRFCEQLKNKEL